MKTRLVIVTSFITTVIVLMIVLSCLFGGQPDPGPEPASPGAQPGGCAPGPAGRRRRGWASVVCLRMGFGGSAVHPQIHDMSLGGCRHYEAGSAYTTSMATVNIPTGATITWMRMLFNDQVS